MAVVPVSGTNVRLLSGVPFSHDYAHTRWHNDKGTQTSWFLNRPVVHTMSEANFQRIEGKPYIRCDEPIDNLWNAKYIMFQNKAYNSKWFYAFITKLEYVNGGRTNVHFQLDVMQTWMFDMNFKPSFVVREHCPLWNEDGTPVVNTVDEGLNYGLEYDDVHVEHYVPNKGIKFLVMVCTKDMHSSKKDKTVATYNGTAQPLTYYALPVMLDGEPVKILSGEDDIPMSSPEKFLSTVYDTESAQKNIISLYMTDSIGCPFTVGGGGETTWVISFTEKDQKITPVRIGEGEKVNDLLYIEDVKRYKTETYDVGGKYDNLPSYKESKLYMHPYTVLTIDDFKGNRTDYKLEYIYDPNIKLNIKGSMGLSNKISYGIQKYNDKANMTNHQDNQYALINNNPQDIPILNDMYAAFLQGNRNSLQNQKDSILFNGFMNNVGSVTGNVGRQMDGMDRSLNGVNMGIGVAQGTGNTILQLQGLEAKQKDIANTPAQITKQGSNTAYDMGHRYDGVTFIKKTLKPEYRKKLEDFFNAYGYKKNEVKMPNFHTRKSWNYVETKLCNIDGSFNNEDLSDLKKVFDNGITLWHTDDIGNYSLSNEVI